MKRKDMVKGVLTAVLLVVTLLDIDAQKLLIVHTNDAHSCIMPLDPHSPDTASADKGGFLRRATIIKELRAENKGLLLADCGDFSQGSAYYELYKGEVEVGLMNVMGYDVATIGNHEFDFGLDNMARLYNMAKFPIVCCNYDCAGTVIEPYVKPYVVLKKGGLRVGVFGLSPQLEGLVLAKNYQGITYLDPISSAQRVADILKNKEKCDLVICLSHLGWKEGEMSDEKLIPQVRNIDIVLGGHSHTLFNHAEGVKDVEGKPVIVNQVGSKGRYVGRLLVTYSK